MSSHVAGIDPHQDNFTVGIVHRNWVEVNHQNLHVLGGLLCLFAFGMGLTSCSPSGDGATSGVPRPTVTISDDAASSRLPTSQVTTEQGVDSESEARDELARLNLVVEAGYQPGEVEVIQQAWDSVFDACMTDAGFVPKERAEQEGFFDDPLLLLARMRFDDIDRIQAEGYHLLFGDVVAGTDGNEVGTDDSSVDIPIEIQDGCKTTANARFGESVVAGEADAVLYEAQSAISSGLRSAPELAPLKIAWSQCMYDKGFPNQDYDDSSRMLKFVENQTVTAEESTMAVADSECRQSTGLSQAQLDYLSNGVDSWIENNPTVVVGVREAIDNELAVAKNILGS